MDKKRTPGLKLICGRRSVRHYLDRPVTTEELDTLLEAARWAPSGLNNQPWRFVTVAGPELKAKIAAQTRYHRIIEEAPVIICILLDNQSLYHREKDIQGIGAAIENLLLAAHDLKLGAVWLGEILKNGDRVIALLELPTRYELMAVVAIGHPDPAKPAPGKERKPLGELVLKRL